MTLEEYSRDIAEKAATNSSELVWNDSRAHNAIIMREFFKTSNEIWMYCGKGSLFGKEFAGLAASDTYNPIPELYEQMKSFFNRGGKLTVVLEKTPMIDDVADELKEELTARHKNGQLCAYRLDGKLKPEYHFSIGDDKKYRREIGADEHNAFACFRDEGKVSLLKTQYEMLKYSSYPISQVC